MENTQLKRQVYAIFSDTTMVVLALIALPVTIVELITQSSSLFLTTIDWLIWLVFLLEFALKIYAEGDATTYIRTNKASSAISLIIVVSPVAALLTENLLPFPVLGIARALRIFRVLGYGDSVYLKNKKKNSAGKMGNL